MFRLALFATACILSAPALSQEADVETQTDDDTKQSGELIWSVTPYLWATSTKVDFTADGTPAGGAEVSFNDLVDATDMAFQIFVEAGREGGNWSGFVDLTYLDMSDDFSGDADGTAVRVKTDSEQWFIDAAIAYWPQGVAEGVNVFGGIRYTDLDDQYYFFDVDANQPLGVLDIQRSFTDALFGIRYLFDIAGHWSATTRADYAFGDSDGTFQLEALFRYAVGKNRQNGILFGYRYKEAKLEDDGLEEDYEYKGPIAGFNFRF